MGNFLWDLRGVPTAGSFRLGWLPDVNQAPGSNTRSEQARSGIFADRTYVRNSVIRQKTDFPGLTGFGMIEHPFVIRYGSGY